MRTLYEIINDAKDGKMPSQEECYYAMLTYESLLNFDHSKLRGELAADNPSGPMMKKMILDNSFNIYKGALDKSPQAWLGANHDPMVESYHKKRESDAKLFDKVVGNIKYHNDSKKLIESYIDLANKVSLSKKITDATYGTLPGKQMNEDDTPLQLSHQMVETLDLLQYMVNCSSWNGKEYYVHDAFSINNKLEEIRWFSDNVINSDIHQFTSDTFKEE